MLKIFVKTASLSEKNPRIMASYSADSDIHADTHGPEFTMYTIPNIAMRRFEEFPGEPEKFPYLPDDWRERLGPAIVQNEAKTRIEAVMSPSEQIASLQEIVDLLMKHGSDVSKWPTQAKNRKAELDDAWNYIRSVNERARALKTMPSNPSSDKNWPTRIAKK